MSDPHALTRLDAVTDELIEEIMEMQSEASEFYRKMLERAFEQQQRVNMVRKMAALPEKRRTS